MHLLICLTFFHDEHEAQLRVTAELLHELSKLVSQRAIKEIDMLEHYGALLLDQKRVTEDLFLVGLLDGQVQRLNEHLVDFLDRVRLVKVEEVGAVLARLEVVLNGIPHRFCDGWDATDSRRAAHNQSLS